MSGWKMTLDDLIQGSGGRALSKVVSEFDGFGTDTRADLKGKIFIALKGENFDAHDFLARAVQSGASALLVHRLPDEAKDLRNQTTVVEVDDTLKALQNLGNFWRRKMPARILGVTGTNGKTTTKEFTAALLATRFQVHYSKGSFNNHWGVPMSLLGLTPSHEVAVIEMGMNHAGELKELSHIAEPDVVLCTMVGRGHLQGLGSIEGVAKAKSEIYENAPEKAMRIFNLENPQTRAMFERFVKDRPTESVITFASLGFARENGLINSPQPHGRQAPVTQASATAWPHLDVSFEVVSLGLESMHIRGEIRGVGGETTVPVFGRQNITNLMAAASFALSCGMTAAEIWKALPECRTVWGRNQWVQLESQARVLFDGYNANPESMRAAIDNFAQLQVSGRKYAVLGEMLEMGEQAPELHRELGETLAHAGIEAACFFGASRSEFEQGMRHAGFQKSLFVSDRYEQSLAPRMLPMLTPNDVVLMKGSRGMQLEKVLMDLKPIDFNAKK